MDLEFLRECLELKRISREQVKKKLDKWIRMYLKGIGIWIEIKINELKNKNRRACHLGDELFSSMLATFHGLPYENLLHI